MVKVLNFLPIKNFKPVINFILGLPVGEVSGKPSAKISHLEPMQNTLKGS